MPQLLSRMDSINWLTPSVAEILKQGASLPGGDGSIREQMMQLQKELANLEAPIKITNVRSSIAYTLFIAQPDFVGRLANRRQVSTNEIRRALARIAENHRNEWTIGYLAQSPESEDSFAILLRTKVHSPLSLRRLMVRPRYRDHKSTFALILGNTLDQRLVVTDMRETGGLVVVGGSNAKEHFMRAVLITLLSMNTPGEMRLVLAGNNSEHYESLLNIPHAVRRLLKSPQDGQRLFLGLVKELERRLQDFEAIGAENIGAYNATKIAQEDEIIPHIVIVIDSLSDQMWQDARDAWLPLLTRILENQGRTGIYAIITSESYEEPDLPESISKLLSTQIVMRPSAGDIPQSLENFHSSLLRFVDAFIINSTNSDIIPVELCAVSEEEMRDVIRYWTQATRKRHEEAPLRQISGTTGMTSMLGRNAVQQTSDDETTQNTPQNVEQNQLSISLHQAQALAAYLGWIGLGPLTDVLGYSQAQAHQIMDQLTAMGIIENDGSATPRFVRLSELPDA